MGRPLAAHEQERLDKLFSEKVEKYLNEGRGKCWMRDDHCAKVVADALAFFAATRYRLHAWSIMPNHVHTVLQPLGGYDLPGILQSWKSYTAKEMNKILGTQGQVWETEYYDHLIRDDRDLQAQIAYVLANPQKAGLREWKWVGAAPEWKPT
jgi:menaquinone-specific isochorismate synthase